MSAARTRSFRRVPTDPRPPRVKKTHRGAARPAPEGEGPLRTCVVTREAHPPERLLRVYASPDGQAIVDARGRASGRGAWLLPRREVLERAESHPAILRRALRVDTLVVHDLLGQARTQNDQQVLDLLSLAARAGTVASGGDVVEGALKAGAGVAILMASDTSETSASRAKSLAPNLPCFILALDKGQLGERIGKGPRSVAVLRPSSVAKALIRELRKGQSLR